VNIATKIWFSDEGTLAVREPGQLGDWGGHKIGLMPDLYSNKRVKRIFDTGVRRSRKSKNLGEIKWLQYSIKVNYFHG